MYRLQFIRHGKDGFVRNDLREFPTFNWAEKALKDELQNEQYRYEANGMKPPPIKKTRIGELEIRIIKTN